MTSPGQSLVSLDGLAKPVVKLLDVISKGAGVIYEPTRIRRKAHADADAKLILAAADAEVSEIARRAVDRLGRQEIRRQENIEAIVADTIANLPPHVSKAAVDPDWTSRFFDSAQDVSEPALRGIWAKVLAREVEEPGSVSRRTLGILKDMGPREATEFQQAASFAWRFGKSTAVIIMESRSRFLQGYDIPYQRIMNLASLGLVGPVLEMSAEAATVKPRYFDHRMHYVGSEPEVDCARIAVTPFTDSGVELLAVAVATYREAYAKAAVGRLTDCNFQPAPPDTITTDVTGDRGKDEAE
jgi:uncharacterized repeat protein (TIGR03899 family)